MASAPGSGTGVGPGSAAAGYGGPDRKRLGQCRGLVALRPVQDDNVIYSFHYYEPAELTSLRPGAPAWTARHSPGCRFRRAEACARLAGARTATRAGHPVLLRPALDAGRVAARIATAAAWGRRHHAAVLLGEFGLPRRLPRSRAPLAARRPAGVRGRGIGWTLWGYDDVMDLARRGLPGGSLCWTRVLRALAWRQPCEWRLAAGAE